MKKYKYDNQIMYTGNDAGQIIPQIITENEISKIFAVHGKSFSKLSVRNIINKLQCEVVHFSGFSPNPKYEEIMSGVDEIKHECCDAVISIGGGSAIDTAKTIIKFAEKDMLHIAIPTTAGTGSEGNRNSVYYLNGVKQSLSDDSMLPEYAILIPDLLSGLPEYQRKSTMLDAFCQCFESIWAVAATDESQHYASRGLKLFIDNYEKYLNWDNLTCKEKTETGEAMMMCADFSGRGTNISQTTAAHAMSYKLASMYGISHGHACSVTLPYIIDYVTENPDKANEKLGPEGLKKAIGIIESTVKLDYVREIFDEVGLENPRCRTEEEIRQLVAFVNPVRLGNNPVILDENAISEIYRMALK